ncbi:MAG: hypothetical protein JRC69_10520, partial [Deltaproteobacteria bacterium]|nr:hypothetical protein [Deltaproteobacteria bacterium]
SDSIANHGLSSTFIAGYLSIMEMRILGYVVILTMQALEVAANSGDGVRLAAREEVEQGLFLDGINVFGNQPTVDHAV